MKQFTITELRKIIQLRHSLTKDRYVSYATVLFGLTEKEAMYEWEILFDIQRMMIYKSGERIPSDEMIEQILTHAFAIDAASKTCGFVNTPYRLEQELYTQKKMVYYTEPESEKLLNIQVNMNHSCDIILYAKLLERGCDVKIVLDYTETIGISSKGIDESANEIDIYHGDIISCMDKSRSFFGNNSGVYLCEGSGKGYSQLLYTKGRGYIRDGQPDRDDKHSYCDHVFNSYERRFMKIGNVYLDASILVENTGNKKKS